MIDALNESRFPIWYYIIPSMVFISIAIVMLILILILNNGYFTYVLDDPYIHLSLSKHIARGLYGVTVGEISSASSSVLWPFVLVLFASSTLHQYIPLILNSIFALLTLGVFIYIILLDKKIARSPPEPFRIVLLCLLIPSLDLIGLAFTGMEHSLQGLLSVLLVCGLILEARTMQVPSWLPLVIILGPLVRYENLCLSVPAIIYLFFRGYHKKALITSIFLFGILFLFSLFLHVIGQPWLPASVLVKGRAMWAIDLAHPFHSLFSVIFSHIKETFLESPSGVLFLFFLFYVCTMICCLKLSSAHKQLTVTLGAGVALYLLVGPFGWYHRYETFISLSVWLLFIYLYLITTNTTKKRIFIFLITPLVLFGVPYIRAFIILPQAANNVYRQQYQMRNFAVNFLKGPIAVNDIGLVSYENPYYVHDIYGLGNIETNKKFRLDSRAPVWDDEIIKEKHIKLAMIYRGGAWLNSTPARWKLLGCLFLNRPKLILGGDRVFFYATSSLYVPFLTHQLIKFRSQLPLNITFKKQCQY